jgi:hypothetical protein
MEALIVWIISGILHLIDCLKGADAPSWFSFWCVYAGCILGHIGWVNAKRRRR